METSRPAAGSLPLLQCPLVEIVLSVDLDEDSGPASSPLHDPHEPSGQTEFFRAESRLWTDRSHGPERGDDLADPFAGPPLPPIELGWRDRGGAGLAGDIRSGRRSAELRKRTHPRRRRGRSRDGGCTGTYLARWGDRRGASQSHRVGRGPLDRNDGRRCVNISGRSRPDRILACRSAAEDDPSVGPGASGEIPGDVDRIPPAPYESALGWVTTLTVAGDGRGEARAPAHLPGRGRTAPVPNSNRRYESAAPRLCLTGFRPEIPYR